jgi:hypothetical protein
LSHLSASRPCTRGTPTDYGAERNSAKRLQIGTRPDSRLSFKSRESRGHAAVSLISSQNPETCGRNSLLFPGGELRFSPAVRPTESRKSRSLSWGFLDKFPILTEQGILKREQGMCLADQGIFRQEQGNIYLERRGSMPCVFGVVGVLRRDSTGVSRAHLRLAWRVAGPHKSLHDRRGKQRVIAPGTEAL